MTNQEIGQLIAARRSLLGLKQHDLGEMTGITTKTIYLIENGKGNPSLDTLREILDVLGLEIFVDIKKVDE